MECCRYFLASSPSSIQRLDRGDGNGGRNTRTSLIFSIPFSHKSWNVQSRNYISSVPSSSSSSLTSSESLVALPPCDSINITSLIPDTTLQSIRMLPEVEQALSALKTSTANNTASILEGLDRAIQIFQHVGDVEYNSMLLLKATYLSQQRQYSDVIQVISLILSMEKSKGTTLTDDEKFVIMSCLLKMHWYNGSFDAALDCAQVINDLVPVPLSSPSSPAATDSDEYTLLKQGCSMNAKALCQLLTLKKLQDADIQRIRASDDMSDNSDKRNEEVSVRQEEWQGVVDIANSLKHSSKLLENAYLTAQVSTRAETDISIQLALSCASSYCNQGVVDLISNIMQTRETLSDCAGHPSDSAMITWKSGLKILERLQQSNESMNIHHTYILKATKARLYCNMAWAILFSSSYTTPNIKVQPVKEDQLKTASEYASLALKLYDEIIVLGNDHYIGDNKAIKHMMGRALGLVASCYARAGSAVTAEGLLQTAIDLYQVLDNSDKEECPITQIDSRSIYLYYSSLCSNWERRESDAKKNQNVALKINNEILSENWGDISAIYSGLWIFTLSDL